MPDPARAFAESLSETQSQGATRAYSFFASAYPKLELSCGTTQVGIQLEPNTTQLPIKTIKVALILGPMKCLSGIF